MVKGGQQYGVADIDVWPISTSLMADMVFCVADMVVADVVCGRYRRFPSHMYTCRGGGRRVYGKDRKSLYVATP